MPEHKVKFPTAAPLIPEHHNLQELKKRRPTAGPVPCGSGVPRPSLAKG